MPPRRVEDSEEENSVLELSESNDEPNQAFEDDEGNPIWFFIHPSINRAWVVNNLTNNIQRHGGVVRPDDDRVDTVLIDEQKMNKERLQHAYDSSFDRERRTIWVEPIAFVGHCIKQGYVSHRLPTKVPMGGRTPGTRLIQTPFTDEDDHNLARYLALKIPDKEAGGRRGNKVYQDLVALGDEPGFPEYKWVKRHTWHSWRNRYSKHKDRFDPLITHYVELEEPTVKHHFPYDRRACRTYVPARPQDDLWEEDDEHNPRAVSPLPKRVRLNKVRGRFSKRPEARAGQPSGSRSQMLAADPMETATDYKALFGDSEDDELPMKHKPQQATLSNRRRSTSYGSPPFLSEPQTTQATLVASPSQTRPARPQPRPSTSKTLPQHFGNTFESSPPDPQIYTDLRKSPPATPSRAPPFSNIGEGQSQSTTVGPRINLGSSSDRGRRRASKVVSQPVTSMAAMAPYLNTRARSKTPGPSDAAEKIQKRARVPSLTQLPEAPNEDDVQTLDSQNASNAPVPARETQDELMIEDHLVNDVTDGSLETRIDGLEATPGLLDSDDQQTDSALRRPPIASASQHQVSSLPDPNVALKNFMNSVPFTYSRPGTNLPSRFNTSFTAFEAARTSTPRSGIQPHARSKSTSVESYPLPGTNASAMKERIETREKQTPYKAPIGTRAAKYASGQ